MIDLDHLIIRFSISNWRILWILTQAWSPWKIKVFIIFFLLIRSHLLIVVLAYINVFVCVLHSYSFIFFLLSLYKWFRFRYGFVSIYICKLIIQLARVSISSFIIFFSIFYLFSSRLHISRLKSIQCSICWILWFAVETFIVIFSSLFVLLWTLPLFCFICICLLSLCI